MHFHKKRRWILGEFYAKEDCFVALEQEKYPPNGLKIDVDLMNTYVGGNGQVVDEFCVE